MIDNRWNFCLGVKNFFDLILYWVIERERERWVKIIIVEWRDWLNIMLNIVEFGLVKLIGIISVVVGVCGFGNCICGFIWFGYKGYGGYGLWLGFGVSLSYNFFYFLILCFVGNVGISKV